jgi:hypothetical protein
VYEYEEGRQLQPESISPALEKLSARRVCKMEDRTMSNSKTNNGESLEYIWIVEGSIGEYDDRLDWVVCAYRSEAEAKRHIECAEARAAELRNKYDSYCDIPAGANEWDPQGRYAHTGTQYIHYEVPLRSLSQQQISGPDNYAGARQ